MHVSQASPRVGAGGPKPHSEETWPGWMPTGHMQGLEDHIGSDTAEARIRGPNLKIPMMSKLPVLSSLPSTANDQMEREELELQFWVRPHSSLEAEQSGNN